MQNLKIRVNSANESKEVQELFFKLGYVKENWIWSGYSDYPIELRTRDGGYSDFNLNAGNAIERQEITIPELRAMANPMKEYLDAKRNYEFVLSTEKDDGFIEIPKGAIRARFYQYDPDELEFENSAFQWWGDEKKKWIDYMDYSKSLRDSRVVWQRDQDEPFLTPECTLNDQYAEIEQVRQALKDNVNHPSHYTQGKVECIDALESATVGKPGIEAVCVANVIKYLWRYEEKNGIEDVKKAQFYLNRLLATLDK